MNDLYEDIVESLEKGRELVVATIISGSGSTPRASGSKMLFFPDGTCSGTIGGGAVESEVIQRARELFNTKAAFIETFGTAPQRGGGQKCGGQVRILLEYVPAIGETVELYRRVAARYNQSGSFLLLGRQVEDGKDPLLRRAVQGEDGTFYGELNVAAGLYKEVDACGVRFNQTALLDYEGHSYVVDLIKPPDTLYLVGAGHVAQELAALTSSVGFRTVVIDDRKEFCTIERFPDAELHLRSDFTSVFEPFDVTPDASIVTMAYTHALDRDVLAQALRTDAGYIGMIGSRRKKEHTYKSLQEEGFQPGDLERVSCPIGLPIAAETPAEIGVSIVAELIQRRAERYT